MPEPDDPTAEIIAQQNSEQLTDSMVHSLRQTRPWTQFLAILGFISVVLMVVVGLVSMVGFSHLADDSTMLPFMLSGIFNIIFGLFYFFPALFLFRYSSAIGRLVNGEGAIAMEEALVHQKSFWKFVGILTLVTVCIGILGIIAAIGIPLFVG